LESRQNPQRRAHALLGCGLAKDGWWRALHL
jgi:hypothetical protein